MLSVNGFLHNEQTISVHGRFIYETEILRRSLGRITALPIIEIEHCHFFQVLSPAHITDDGSRQHVAEDISTRPLPVLPVEDEERPPPTATRERNKIRTTATTVAPPIIRPRSVAEVANKTNVTTSNVNRPNSIAYNESRTAGVQDNSLSSIHNDVTRPSSAAYQSEALMYGQPITEQQSGDTYIGNR